MLEDLTLDFEDLPRKPVKSGGKGAKMSKHSQSNEASKPAKRYQKTRGEHYKDIVIAILVASVIAFIGGVKVANNNHSQVNRAVQAATVSVEAPSKK
jgi:hypothetical protein